MITLNTYEFDEEFTTVRDELAEVGGKDARVFVVTGWIVGKSSVEAIESELDTILDESSKEDGGAVLSLRAGRCFGVERDEFDRRVDAQILLGVFRLKLTAPDPFEHADEDTVVEWGVTQSGDTKAVVAGGNVFSKPRFALTSNGDVVNPTIADGERSITYLGTVSDGETLVLDGQTGSATLEGEDVTPYTEGDVPQVSPEGTTLEYTDDDTSSHTAAIEVRFRDRWW